MQRSEKEKAAEKWADKHTKVWASFSEFVHLQQAFLAGVAWQKRNTKIVSCWKCDTILTITNGKRDKPPQKKTEMRK